MTRLLWIALLAGTVPGTVPAERAFAQVQAVEKETPEAEKDDTDDSAEREQKRRIAVTAIWLLFLVGLVGVALMVLVLLWGIRVRRVARSGLPAQSLPDDFWYLRSRGHREQAGEQGADGPPSSERETES